MKQCEWAGVPLHCLKCGDWYGLHSGECVFESVEEAKAYRAQDDEMEKKG